MLSKGVLLVLISFTYVLCQTDEYFDPEEPPDDRFSSTTVTPDDSMNEIEGDIVFNGTVPNPLEDYPPAQAEADKTKKGADFAFWFYTLVFVIVFICLALFWVYIYVDLSKTNSETSEERVHSKAVKQSNGDTMNNEGTSEAGLTSNNSVNSNVSTGLSTRSKDSSNVQSKGSNAMPKKSTAKDSEISKKTLTSV